MSGYGLYIKPEIMALGLSPAEAVILAMIDYETSLMGSCSCTDKQLAQLTHGSARSVNRAVNRLSQLGYVSIKSAATAWRSIVSLLSEGDKTPIRASDRYVYLMHNPASGEYKIGISADPDGRAKSIETGSGFHIKLLAKHRHKHARRIEQSMHEALSEYRKIGEWFSLGLPEEDAVALFNKLLAGYGE